MKNILIAPSILSANFSNLREDIEMINESSADWIHADVMDGVFVPNISFGFPILESVSSCTNKLIDVHLMIVHPDQYIERLSKIGVGVVSVHYEACVHLHRTISLIKHYGMKCSVALNPHTPVCVLKDILDQLDMVLIMSVNPGFGNQAFIEHTYRKVEELKSMISSQHLNTLIEVDGGVNDRTGKQLKNAGVDILVAGGYVFNNSNPKEMISQLKQL